MIVKIMFVISILFVTVQCKSLGSKYELEVLKLKWKAHNINVTSFKCNEPQLRNIDFADISEETKEMSFLNVVPASTVLARCDSATGCCNNKYHKCGPKSIENIPLIFYIPQVAGDNKKKGLYKEIIVANHTACTCQSKSNRPK